MSAKTTTPAVAVVLAMLVSCTAVRGDDPGEVVDCTYDVNVGGGVPTWSALQTSSNGYVTHAIYCYNGFEQCTTGNGCCYKGSDKKLWTDGELAGIILNLTALFALSVLVLVTCGATYCNSREDVSDIFAGRKPRRK